MPTPSDDTRQLSAALEHERASHTTCPPDNGRIEEWRTHEGSHGGQRASTSQSAQPQPQPESLLEVSETIGQAEHHIDQDAQMKLDDTDQDLSTTEGQSPASTTTEAGDAEPGASPPPSTRPAASSYSTNYEFSNIRVSFVVVDAHQSALTGFLATS